MKNRKFIPVRRAATAAEKATEQINALADAFAEASPDVQQNGLDAMTELIEKVTDETSKNWLIHFRRTFEFLQNQGGAKR